MSLVCKFKTYNTISKIAGRKQRSTSVDMWKFKNYMVCFLSLHKFMFSGSTLEENFPTSYWII